VIKSIDQEVFVRPLHKGMGEAVAARTVFRPKETWKDVARRVARGNLSLCPLGDPDQDEAEMYRGIASGGILMSGRHLQHGDSTQKGRNLEVFSNCSTAALSCVKFYLLLNGSGVGRVYDDSVMVIDWTCAPKLTLRLSVNHPDFPDTPEKQQKLMRTWGISQEEMLDFVAELGGTDVPEKGVSHVVQDSREGWAASAELYESMAFANTVRMRTPEVFSLPEEEDLNLCLDFSPVRPEGAPIAGMQDRPASGPLSVIQAFYCIRKIVNKQYGDIERWEQAMRVDHELSTQVQVGGARRAARMSTKWWKDPGIFKFIRIKADCGLWTSNNSVAVDQEFWDGVKSGKDAHAVAVFNEVTKYMFINGEPGFVNVDKLEAHGERVVAQDGSDFSSDRYQISYAKEALYAVYLGLQNTKYHHTTNPCITGDTLIETSEGFLQAKDLVGKQFTARIRNNENAGDWVSTQQGFWSNGVKEVFEIRLESGKIIKATGNHQFYVRIDSVGQSGAVETGGYWLEVNELVSAEMGHSLFVSGEADELMTVDGWEKIDRVEYVGEEEVFDCSIPGPNCYFANGILSHNCGEITIHLLGAYCVIADIAPSLLPEYSLQEISNFRKNPKSAPEGFWEDWDARFFRSCSTVARSLVRVNSLPALYGKEVARTERIGVGLTGVHEYAWLRFGLCFDDLVDPDISKSLPFWETLAKGRDAVRQAADEYCVKLNRNKPHTYCTMKPAGCATPETEVKTTEGAKTLRDVFAANGVSMEQIFSTPAGTWIDPTVKIQVMDENNEAKNITKLYINGVKEVFEISFDDTTSVRLTGNHKLKLADGQWRRVDELGADAVVDAFYGVGIRKPMRIARIQKMEPEVTVDIEVADTHTYQLGNGVVSHNTTSKLFGLTEGAHLPSHKFLLRWVQFDQSSTQVQELKAKGYPTRDLKGFSGKTIVGFPTLPTITSIGMPYVITAPEATPAQQYEWLRRLEKYWIGEVGGNQVSYTLKVYTNQVSLEEFRDIVLENQPTVRCCSVMPSRPDHELGYEYLPEEEVSAERFIEIVSGIKDEEIEQAIDMNTLLCASGACPI